MSGESIGGDRAPTEEPDCELPRSSPAVKDRASEELDGGEVATFGCQPVRLGSVITVFPSRCFLSMRAFFPTLSAGATQYAVRCGYCFSFLVSCRAVQGACWFRQMARVAGTRCGGPSFCFRRSFTVAKGERSGGEGLSPFRSLQCELVGPFALGSGRSYPFALGDRRTGGESR